MANLPEPVRHTTSVVRHPSIVRAAVSPTSVAVTAAGAGVGLLADPHTAVLAIVLGAAAWSGRMLAAIVHRSRKERAAQPHPAALDPYSVPEPWRQLLRQAADAQNRFDRTVAEWVPGPLKDRLSGLQPRVWSDVDQIGTVARRGAALAGWTAGVPDQGRPTVESLGSQLRDVEAEKARLGTVPSSRRDALERSEAAIAAQIRALHASNQAETLVLDRLRIIVARLEETVTSVLILGVEGSEVQADAIASSLDEINDEIVSLHQGLAETAHEVTAGPSSPPPAPT